MNENKPKVSIIMPSYNKEKFIGFTIESILRQSFEDFELIVIDDCSADGSVSVVKAFHDSRIWLYQNEKNVGIPANRNRGIDLARGDYIALMDADDLCPEYRLEHEVEFLNKNSDVDVVYGGCQEIDENGNNGRLYISAFHNPAYIRALLVVRDIIPNSSGMYRKQFVEKNNIRYREGFYGMDDYLFWVECSVKGNIAGIPETMLYWRNFPGNTTNEIVLNPDKERVRAERYAEIHNKALEWNGFRLTETELQVFNRIFAENNYYIENESELEIFYWIIKKMLLQAESMDHSYEWKFMLKRQFGIALENSYLWRT